MKMFRLLWLTLLCAIGCRGVAGCNWTEWSSCSVTCGKGIRSRSGTGPDCTQSPTKTCSALTSCYATHLTNLNVTVTQHPENNIRPSRPKALMIDGMPTTVNGDTIASSSCASTGQGDNPWVRLDLKKAYLVSVVRVIIFGSTGQDVAIRVGSSLTNSGNDNHQCGNFPYNASESTTAIWRNVSCSPPVWGRYINFDRVITNHFLEICEVSFTYDDVMDDVVMVDMTITKDGSDINGISLVTTKGQGLGQPVTCSAVNSTNKAYLTWKHQNNLVQNFSSGQQPGIYQANEKNSQLLYINKPTGSDAGEYSCEYSLEGTILLSKSFTLVVGYATHLANLNVTVTQHPENKNRPSRPKTFVIDGIPATVSGQSLLPGSCASTGQGDNPWVRLDLKKAYLVSVVRVIIFGTTGLNVAVRVGSSLTNNGNDNHQCGMVPYIDSENRKVIWRNVSCSPPVWGRYINFDRTVTNHYLEICEVSFTFDDIVHIRIESKGTDVDGQSISVYQGDGVANSIDCSIEPDSSGFTVPLTWKYNGTDIQTLSSGQSFGIYQVNEIGTQRLYINNTTDSDAGTYSCEASASNVRLFPKIFTLQFKVQTTQEAPSPPQNVTVTATTSSSLHVQWNPPSQPNGTLQFYKAYYKPSSSSDDFSVSNNIPIEENSFDITGLLPYTSYDIYVTVTNDAETDPESQSSETVQGRTHAAPPIVPEVPISANNDGQFIAPHINNSNGPILFICIIVYHGPLDVCSPSNTDIPKNIGAYNESSNWYVAAKYIYQEYESNIAGKSFVIGDGQTTTVNSEEYTNVEVTPGYRYSIYILITSAGDSENYDVSTAPIQYAVALSVTSNSDSDSDVIIAAVVPTVILLFVNVVLVIKLTRRTHKLDDSVSTSTPIKMEATYMRNSSAYGLTVQSAKSNEKAYEEISSSTTEKDNEPTYLSAI